MTGSSILLNSTEIKLDSQMSDYFTQIHFKISIKNINTILVKKYSFEKIKRLVNLLEILNLTVTNNNLEKLLNLNNIQLNKVEQLLNHLYDKKLCDQEAFDRTLDFIADIPDIPMSTVTKIKGKEPLERSQFIIDNKLHWYAEKESNKNRYLSGGQAKIKKLFGTATHQQPVYVLKQMTLEDDTDSREKQKQVALNEAKYHAITGDKAYIFERKKEPSKSKFYCAFPWKNGKDLTQYSDSRITTYPIKARLGWFMQLLLQLDKFHQNGLVHRDIKPLNIIFDDTGPGGLYLIDFGGIQKQYLPDQNTGKTPCYLPKNAGADGLYHYHYDVYGMGIVAAKFFPELFAISPKEINLRVFLLLKEKLPKLRHPDKKNNEPTTQVRHKKVSIIKKEMDIQEKAIMLLVNSMLNTDSYCTTKQLLQYTKAVFENFDSLNISELNEITEKSIKKSGLTVDDILNDKTTQFNFRP